MDLPAHGLLMDGEVGKRPGGNGVDVTAVEGTGVVRLGSTAEGSEGLASVAEKGLAKLSRLQHGVRQR